MIDSKKKSTQKTKDKTKEKKTLVWAWTPPPPKKKNTFSLLHGYILYIVLASNIKVYLKHDEFVKYYAPSGNKVNKGIFSVKVTVKVTRSSNLLSFERALLVEYACQIWSLYLLRFKSYREC